MDIRHSQAAELLPVIDRAGNVIGVERRDRIHAEGLPHMAAHALIFNVRGEALLQLRAPQKDTFPGYWDLSAGGHVGVGETFEETLHRELAEELGLEVECRLLREIGPAAWTGWERVREYVGRTAQQPRPDPREISAIEFVAPEALLAEIDSGQRQATPVLRSCLEYYLNFGCDRERSRTI